MDNRPLTRQEILDLINSEFERNYRSGAPKIPPHQHNGVDNLQINGSDILNLPASSPGGDNEEVQFNNNGAFGGDPQFTFTPATGIVHLHDIDNRLASPNDGYELSMTSINGQRLVLTTNNADADGNVLGSTGDVLLASDGTIPDSNTGSIDITSGVADDVGNTSTGVSGHITLQTGTSNKQTGAISIITGGVTGNPSPNSAKSGNLSIKTGFSYGNAGDINIESGNSSAGDGGDITIFAKGAGGGNNNGSVTVQAVGNTNTSTMTGINLIVGGAAGTNLDGGYIQLNTGTPTGSGAYGAVNINNGNLGVGGTPFNTTYPLVFLGDVNAPPPNTPSGGGYLYSDAGALHWVGSSGTDTPIAPA